MLFLLATQAAENVTTESAGSSNSIPIEAAWAGVVAVIAAALITALGVYLQTRKTLQAERERLQIQLSHDRATRERAELRSILDAAATCMDEVAFHVIRALSLAARVKELTSGATEQADTRHSDGDPVNSVEKDESANAIDNAIHQLDTKREELFAQIRKADAHTSQLGMRLGVEHPVRTHYRNARNLFADFNTRILDSDLDDDDEIQDSFVKAGESKRSFESAASELIRAEV
jgi:predicted RNase H-like nuclease (RuvC/YqgF family)